MGNIPTIKICLIPVADPGFPRGGGANSPGGRQNTILPKFPKNCMKLKEFGPPGGARVPCDPLRSATEFIKSNLNINVLQRDDSNGWSHKNSYPVGLHNEFQQKQYHHSKTFILSYLPQISFRSNLR